MTIPGLGPIKWAAIAATVIAVLAALARTVSGIKRAARDRQTVEHFEKEQKHVQEARKAGDEAARELRDLPDDDLDQRLRDAGL